MIATLPSDNLQLFCMFEALEALSGSEDKN